MTDSANELAQKWERRQREQERYPYGTPLSVDHRMSALPKDRTLGRLHIDGDTTAPCHVQIIGSLIVAEFPDGGKGIYNLLPGDNAYFEPVDAGE